LPSLQQLYRIWAYVNAHSYAISSLKSNLKEYLDFEKNKYKKNSIILKNNKTNKIIFNDIGFSHNKNNRLFSINKLEINYPGSYSITGKSGSGKSTLADIITGLISPKNGSIEKSGIFINESKIGYVPQEISILNGTIADNLTLGNSSLLEDKEFLDKCLIKANIYDFIYSLPKNLETILGEKSLKLSGGQKQRIGIARALLIKPKILILDESTNALDEKSKEIVIKNLFSERDKILIFLITHDLKLANICHKHITISSKGSVELIEDKLN